MWRLHRARNISSKRSRGKRSTNMFSLRLSVISYFKNPTSRNITIFFLSSRNSHENCVSSKSTLDFVPNWKPQKVVKMLKRRIKILKLIRAELFLNFPQHACSAKHLTLLAFLLRLPIPHRLLSHSPRHFIFYLSFKIFHENCVSSETSCDYIFQGESLITLAFAASPQIQSKLGNFSRELCHE